MLEVRYEGPKRHVDTENDALLVPAQSDTPRPLICLAKLGGVHDERGLLADNINVSKCPGQQVQGEVGHVLMPYDWLLYDAALAHPCEPTQRGVPARPASQPLHIGFIGFIGIMKLRGISSLDGRY